MAPAPVVVTIVVDVFSFTTCVDVVYRAAPQFFRVLDDASGASASIRMSCCCVTPRLSGANVGALRTPGGSSTRSTTERVKLFPRFSSCLRA